MQTLQFHAGTGKTTGLALSIAQSLAKENPEINSVRSFRAPLRDDPVKRLNTSPETEPPKTGR